MIQSYRPNVGMMIINSEKKVWMGKRADGEKYLYNQQMPQGGIDLGETPDQAVYRELKEETGLTPDKVKLITISKHWYKYDLPVGHKKRKTGLKGQRQKWFLFLFLGTDNDFKLNAFQEEIEFSSFKWMNLEDITQAVVPFKRGVYKQVIREFKPVIDALILSPEEIQKP